MILTTLIISFYMILVYVVGDGDMLWKLALVLITLIGTIYQIQRGRKKGKDYAESLVDNDVKEIKILVEGTISNAAEFVSSKLESEE